MAERNRRRSRFGRSAAVALVVSCVAATLAQVPAPPAGADHFPLIAPATGQIVSVYGDCRDGCSRMHLGYDIENAIGAPIYAAASGTVINVVRNRACPSIGSTAGNQLVIVHPGGVYRTVYLHLEAVLVNDGQVVTRGQQIGTMGNVGSLACIEPPHLHFEVRQSNVALNLNATLPLGMQMIAGTPLPRHFDLAASPDIEIDDQSMALNGDGRLGVVTRATGGATWYTAQASAGAGWTGWQSLGGIATSTPELERNADARLQVFVRGADGAVWTNHQTAPGGGWLGWMPIGDGQNWFIGNPVTVRRPDGRIDLFIRAVDGAVWHASQTAPNGAAWTGWQRLGGIVSSDVSVAIHGGGGVEVFGRGADGALWTIWQDGAGNWWGWVSLGGRLNGAAAVGTNADGRLEVFVRGADNTMYHAYQTAAPGAWTGWGFLGGVLRNDPSVARNADGRLEAFTVGSDFSVWHAWQTGPGVSAWTAWLPIGGHVGSTTAIHANADGRLQLVVRADGSIGIGTYSAGQTAPGTPTWFGWSRL